MYEYQVIFPTQQVEHWLTRSLTLHNMKTSDKGITAPTAGKTQLGCRLVVTMHITAIYITIRNAQFVKNA